LQNLGLDEEESKADLHKKASCNPEEGAETEQLLDTIRYPGRSANDEGTSIIQQSVRTNMASL